MAISKLYPSKSLSHDDINIINNYVLLDNINMIPQDSHRQILRYYETHSLHESDVALATSPGRPLQSEVFGRPIDQSYIQTFIPRRTNATLHQKKMPNQMKFSTRWPDDASPRFYIHAQFSVLMTNNSHTYICIRWSMTTQISSILQTIYCGSHGSYTISSECDSDKSDMVVCGYVITVWGKVTSLYWDLRAAYMGFGFVFRQCWYWFGQFSLVLVVAWVLSSSRP